MVLNDVTIYNEDGKVITTLKGVAEQAAQAFGPGLPTLMHFTGAIKLANAALPLASVVIKPGMVFKYGDTPTAVTSQIDANSGMVKLLNEDKLPDEDPEERS